MAELLPINTGPQPLKLRVDDYLLLDGAGAFADYAKTELIEGEIIFMNAQHRPHARVKTRLYDAIRDGLRAINSPLVAIVEASVRMPDHSVPEPDIVVTSEPEGEGLVPLVSVALLVEVADTSLQQDVHRKAPLYARQGVPEYWIADIGARTLLQFWGPMPAGWGNERAWRFGEAVASASIAGLVADTSIL